MTFDPDYYVTRTPGGNIGLRDSIGSSYFYETQPYTGPQWAKDGFNPKLARKIADEINRLANEIEEEARQPKIENWPPQEGDAWKLHLGGFDYTAYYLNNGFRLRNRVTGKLEGMDETGWPKVDTVQRQAESVRPELRFRAS